MREYRLTDAFDSVKSSFSFLVNEWEFKKTREDDINYGCYFEYLKGNLIVYLGYDYKDNCFYFDFILNGQRQLFMEFFKEKDSNFDWRLFQPNDYQYKESLMRNVEYLKKYKDDVLKMI